MKYVGILESIAVKKTPMIHSNIPNLAKIPIKNINPKITSQFLLPNTKLALTISVGDNSSSKAKNEGIRDKGTIK